MNQAPSVETIRGPRSAETEAAIIGAARTLMAEGGLAALSMRTVAERAGLSATAIYHYFEGKDDLVRCVVRAGYERFDTYLRDAMEGQPAGSLERLMALGKAYVRFAFENQEYFRVLYNIQERVPRDIDELPGGGGYALLRQCVEDAMAAGVVGAVNPDLVAHFLWTFVHGLVTLRMACSFEGHDHQCDLSMSTAEVFSAFVPLLVEGLQGAAGGRAVETRAMNKECS